MSDVVIKNGYEYTKSNGRLRYNSELHTNYGRPYTKADLIYICSMWDSMRKQDIALAIGKTHSSVLSKVYKLRKIGLFDYYKKLGKSN